MQDEGGQVGCGFPENCCHSNTLRRCLEVDSSSNCSDCYFCHNCENLQNCMFCFNTKNKSFAIGNAEVGKGEYARMKKLVLAEIAIKLDKAGGLSFDAFSIGAKQGR